MTKKVRFYDPETKTVVVIPEQELAGRTVQVRVEGVEGEVHVEHHLPAELVDRIRRLAETFAEVFPSPLDKWLRDFSLDQNPEREVVVWEMMARVFNHFARPGDTLGRKKGVFSTVLDCSCAPWDYLPDKAIRKRIGLRPGCEALSRKEVRAICDGWVSGLAS